MKDYIRSVLDVVAESPFVPLEAHAKKGVLAVEKLAEAMEAYCAGNQSILEERTDEIDKLEHVQLRNPLPNLLTIIINISHLIATVTTQSVKETAVTNVQMFVARIAKESAATTVLKTVMMTISQETSLVTV